MNKLITTCIVLLAFATGASAQYTREAAVEAEANAPWESIASQRSQLFNFDWKFRPARL